MCTYYWGENRVSGLKGMTYSDLSSRWIKQCEKLKINHHCLHIPAFNKAKHYQTAINYKPRFIKAMLRKHNMPVAYCDVDIFINKFPKLFKNEDNVDLMCFNWNYDPAVSNNIVDNYIVETAGGVFYFANTKQSFYLLDLWDSALSSQQYKNMADDRVFALIFNKHNVGAKLRTKFLPVEYLYVPQHFSHLKLNNPVLIHDAPITSEEEAHKLGSNQNRIPKNYRLQYSVRNRNKLKTLTLPLNPDNNGLKQRMKKHGFKFVHRYKFKTFSAKCESPDNQVVSLSSPYEIIKLWKNHGLYCNIVISEFIDKLKSKHLQKQSKFGNNYLKVDKGTDLYYPGMENGIMNPTLKNAKLFLRKSPFTYQLVNEWYNSNDYSFKKVANLFNENPEYYNHLRTAALKNRKEKFKIVNNPYLNHLTKVTSRPNSKTKVVKTKAEKMKKLGQEKLLMNAFAKKVKRNSQTKSNIKQAKFSANIGKMLHELNSQNFVQPLENINLENID